MKHLMICKSTKQDHEFVKKIEHMMKSYDFEVIFSHSANESRKIIQKLKEPTRIYCVGGDGTLNNMIQEVVNTEHELVVIPLGTGNDFSRLLIKERNPVKILKQSLTHQAQLIDTIQLNDKYYINATCFALDRVVANHVHDTPEIPLIPASKSYIVSVMQHVFQYSFNEVTIEADGHIIYQGHTTLCTINNGQYYGGGFQITPNASLTDGFMDICVVDQVPKTKIPYLFQFLIRHQLHKRKEVHFFKAKSIKVITSTSSNMDGERYKSHEYIFHIHPQSVRIVTNYQGK